MFGNITTLTILIFLDPVAICNCDTVLRSLLSVLLNYWLHNRESKIEDSPTQLEMSCKLIKLLSFARWIPNPITSIHHLFSTCTPYQLYLLLMTAWKYLKVSIDAISYQNIVKHRIRKIYVILFTLLGK